eukprot:80636-Rhodomonas_salina.1
MLAASEGLPSKTRWVATLEAACDAWSLLSVVCFCASRTECCLALSLWQSVICAASLCAWCVPLFSVPRYLALLESDMSGSEHSRVPDKCVRICFWSMPGSVAAGRWVLSFHQKQTRTQLSDDRCC